MHGCAFLRLKLHLCYLCDLLFKSLSLRSLVGVEA